MTMPKGQKLRDLKKAIKAAREQSPENMPTPETVAPRRRSPLVWITAIAIVLAAGGVGGYQFYLARREHNTRALIENARASKEAGDWQQAIQSYRLYLQRRPSDLKALDEFTDVLVERLDGSPEMVAEAVRSLRRLVRLVPEDLESTQTLVQLYIAVGDNASAEELALQWQQLAPDSVDAALTVAQARHLLHKDVQSAEGIEQALDRFPTQGRLYPPLVELLAVNLKRPDKAEVWLEKGLAAAPDSPEVQLAAFGFHHEFGDPAKAETHLQRALELAPDSPRVLIPAAKFHLARHRLDEAATMLERAARVAPDNRALLSARADWAVKTGDRAQWLSAADEILKRTHDGDLEMRALAAALLIRAGDMRRADDCIVRLETESGSDHVKDWLHVLRGARSLYQGKPYAAIPELEQAARRQTNNTWATELLATAYTQTGAAPEASDLYRKLLATAPQSAQARYALARIAWQSGRFDEALAQINAVPAASLESSQATKSAAELIRVAAELERVTASGTELPAPQRDDYRRRLSAIQSTLPRDAVNAEMFTRCHVLVGEPMKVLEWLGENGRILSAEAALSAGRTLIAAGQSGLADRVAEALKASDAGSTEGLQLRVLILASRRDDDGARNVILSSGTAPPIRGKLWSALADACFARDDRENGLRALREAIALLPDDVSIMRRIMRETTDFKEVVQLAERMRSVEGDAGLHWRYEQAAAALRMSPDRETARQAAALLTDCLLIRSQWLPARLLLGFAHETAGDLEAAADAYRKVLGEQPGMVSDPLAIRLVEILRKLGQFAEADGLLDRIAAAAPRDPEVLRLQTQRHLRHRNTTAAADAAERMLELQSSDPAWAALTADLQVRAGNPRRAEQIARDALQAHPGSTSLLWSLTRALVAMNQPEAAERTLRQAAEQFADGVHHVMLVRFLSQLGRQDEAVVVMDEALKAAPRDAVVLGAASDFFGGRGDRARQLDYARQAVAARGESGAESLTLAAILFSGTDADERAEARAMVDARLKSKPDDAAALVLKARMALGNDAPAIDEAKQTLADAVAIEPRSVEARRMLASIQLQEGHADDASETIAAGLALSPQDVDLLLASARIAMHRGLGQQAIGTLRRALDLRPRDPEALALIAQAFRMNNEASPGIALLEGMVPAKERTAQECALLAGLHATARNGERADALYEEALRKAPRNGAIARDYGMHLALAKRCDELYALASSWRDAIDDDPLTLAVLAELTASHCETEQQRDAGFGWLADIAANHPEHAADATLRTALAYYQHGNLNDAERAFRKSVSLAPRSPGAVNGLAWLVAADLNRPHDALTMLEEFDASGAPPTAEMLDTHGFVLLKLGRLEDAQVKLRTAIELAGQTPTLTAATFRLGEVLQARDKKDEAGVYFRHALELDRRLGGLTEAEKAKALSLLSR